MQEIKTRIEKGEELFKLNHINRINEHLYKVKSQSCNKFYDIISTELGWKCNCPDNTFRNVKCKHICAIEFSFKLRKEVQSTVTIEQLNTLSCIFCESKNFVKDAIRHNKYGDVQRYLCKDC